jgi:lipase chaperone LimK
MIKNRLLFGFALAAAVFVSCGAVWIIHAPSGLAPAAVLAPGAAPGSGTVDANPFAKGEYMAQPAAQAPSANTGTGVFKLDDKGRLALDADTRIRLEMLVSALPANATMHELQEAELAAVEGLPQPAAKEAVHILRAYVGYTRADAALNAEFAAAAGITPEAMLDKVIALRRQHLGTETADALFAEQERHDRYGIRIAMLEADPKLTAQEKLTRMEALQRTLPGDAAAIGAEIDASRSALLMEQEVAALRQQGATEAQVRQLRERQVGPEAAESIVEMEEQKMDWERRQQAFQQQKNAIVQMRLGEQQERDRIEMLLSQLYSEEERHAARAFHQLRPAR